MNGLWQVSSRVVLVLLALVAVGLAAPPEKDRSQSAIALSILEPWQAKNAQSSARVLHIICWTPSDREFPAGHRERLSRMLLHIQNFYAQEMERHGLGRKTFGLAMESPDQIKIHEVRGVHPFAHYEMESGSEIRKECLPALQQAGLNPDQETMAIFCNLATWDETQLTFTHKSPYYAGGSYRSGTAWQLDSPELDILNLPKKAPLMQDGQYGRISLGKHNTIFIGGMAHELGHAFGLPHNKERPDEGVRGRSLMGSGNQTYGDDLRDEGPGTFLPWADALRLVSHPLFCGRQEKTRNPSESTIADLQLKVAGKAISVSGTVTGTPPVYAVVAYFDPEGNSDYNQTSATAIPDAQGRFTVQSEALSAGKASVLQLIPLHANGAIDGDQTLARMRYSYTVGADGVPDLEPALTRLALEPVVKAIVAGNLEQADRLAKRIKTPAIAAVAQSLLNTTPPTATPAEYRGRAASESLTTFKADSANVGWSRVTFNRIPEASLLLESAGQLFATGIYAHAPARHEYNLGGQWDTLSGQVGLATGHNGSVQFEIVGDGRSLWKSETIQEDQLAPFEVTVTGVQKITLITTNTEDGANGDWGLWLAPLLTKTKK